MDAELTLFESCCRFRTHTKQVSLGERANGTGGLADFVWGRAGKENGTLGISLLCCCFTEQENGPSALGMLVTGREKLQELSKQALAAGALLGRGLLG